MSDANNILANISITYNHLSQFEFIVTGDCEATKRLARAVVELARRQLGDKIFIGDNKSPS